MPGTVLQAHDELEFPLQSVYAIVVATMGLAIREDLPALSIRALVYGQALDLLERKIPDVEAPVSARAARETLGHIRYAIEVNIVEHDKLIVTGGDDVLLEIVGAHGIRKRLGLQSVLRKMARSTAVGDNDRTHNLH